MSIFKKKITDSDVLDFLEKNPNFFISHPEILEILEIKHASGEATSLIENAEHNQNLFIKIQHLVLQMISETSLNSLATAVEVFFHEELKTEICKVYFFTPENSYGLDSEKIITPEIATSIFSDLFKENDIALGGVTNEVSGMVFGAKANIKEAAIGKLKSSKIAGTLALGSSELEKFPKDSETLFLEFVISVFSNQIDKILPVADG